MGQGKLFQQPGTTKEDKHDCDLRPREERIFSLADCILSSVSHFSDINLQHFKALYTTTAKFIYVCMLLQKKRSESITNW